MSLKLSDLDFNYPPDLVATFKSHPSRVLCTQLPRQNLSYSAQDSIESHQTTTQELSNFDELFSQFKPGDILVLNDTKVLSRRLFTLDQKFEVLFLSEVEDSKRPHQLWKVLCPASQWPKQQKLQFAGGLELELIEKGLPQTVLSSIPLTESYFQQYGDLPLPPYILKARGERRMRSEDEKQYQTAWAEKPGSFAAPTASLHFDNLLLQQMAQKYQFKILKCTLHVGLGTFLPIKSSLEEHQMHSEVFSIENSVWTQIQQAKKQGHHIWALGTTVTRVLESMAQRDIDFSQNNVYTSETNIFIIPGHEFKIIDRLMTNFHQPQSTLLALVSAFAGLDLVKKVYAKAIENKMRLFSYGDLSVWIR